MTAEATTGVFTTFLLALRELDTRNLVTPCQMPGLDHLWTSDDHEEREAAAHRCCSCPLLDHCANYAMTTEQFHVWAGVDLTTTTRKEKR
jgi:hypothetical protein